MMHRRAEKQLDAIVQIKKNKLGKKELKDVEDSYDNYSKKLEENDCLKKNGEIVCFFGNPIFSTL
jgi:hypothetical protein